MNEVIPHLEDLVKASSSDSYISELLCSKMPFLVGVGNTQFVIFLDEPWDEIPKSFKVDYALILAEVNTPQGILMGFTKVGLTYFNNVDFVSLLPDDHPIVGALKKAFFKVVPGRLVSPTN